MSDDEARSLHARIMAQRNIAFAVSLLALSVGCFLERPSLALIVPSAVLLGLLCTPYLIPRGGKRD